MAYQKVGIGSSANDGTGDTLRVGADKINENFEDLFGKINGVANSAISNGTALTSDTVVLRTAAQTLTNKTLTAPVIGVISNSGNLTLPSGSPDTLVGRATTDTLTNKTLTAPILGGTTTTASGNLIVDPATQIIEVRGSGTTEGQIQLNCRQNSHGQKIVAQPHSAGVTNTMLLPTGGNSTLVSEVATQTLTNKTLTAPSINGATFSGVLGGAIIGGVESKSGAGALSLTHLITEVTSTGTDALTLANGTAGQVKIITMIVDGGDATLQPATFHDGTSILFDAVGESVVLVYHNTIGWKAVSVSGATIS